MDKEAIMNIKRQILVGSFEPTNIEVLRKIEKTIIESHDVNVIRLFAQKVEGANIPSLQEAMCSEYKKVMFQPQSERAGIVMSEYILTPPTSILTRITSFSSFISTIWPFNILRILDV